MQAVSVAEETPIRSAAGGGDGLRWPPQVKYIIGNEACERFSFYGMRNILTVFLADYLLRAAPMAVRAPHAKEIFHLFVMAVYFTPLFGGYLADRIWGKYRTILWLSLVYSAGHALLAIFDDQPTGFYLGLFLIALGSGGIKPCVASFVGDQFTAAQKSLLPKIFAAYYWAVNKASKVQPEAWKFVNFLSQHSDDFLTGTSFVQPLVGWDSKAAAKEIPFIETWGKAYATGKFDEVTEHYSEVQDVLTKMVNDAVFDKKPVADAAREASDEVTRILGN